MTTPPSGVVAGAGWGVTGVCVVAEAGGGGGARDPHDCEHLGRGHAGRCDPVLFLAYPSLKQDRYRSMQGGVTQSCS